MKPASPEAPAIRWGDSPATQLPGTEFLFWVYLAVFVIEYGGLTTVFPVLRVLRISTVLAYLVALVLLVRFGLNPLRHSWQGKVLTFLTVFTAASIVWAIVQTHVVTTFRYMCDYLCLFIATAYLLDRPARLRKLAVVATLVMLVLFVRNLDLLTSTAGSDRLVRFQTAYFMGDGNDFAWGAMTLLTFPLFLVLSNSGLVWRMCGLAGGLCTLVIVVLTQSRGGALALGAAVLFYGLVLAKRKGVAMIGVVVLLAGVWMLAPSQFRNRVESINDYQEDNSAQGRIRAWKAAAHMAVDYPLGVGAGNFSSAYGRYYRSDDLSGWAANRWISAHSVYFKTLGELGIIGLVMLVVLIIRSLVDNSASVRMLRALGSQSSVPAQWPAAVSVGLVGYAVAGVFLGGVTYPHLFLLTGLVVAGRRLALAAVSSTAKQSVEVMPPARHVREPVRARSHVRSVREAAPIATAGRTRVTSVRQR